VRFCIRCVIVVCRCVFLGFGDALRERFVYLCCYQRCEFLFLFAENCCGPLHGRCSGRECGRPPCELCFVSLGDGVGDFVRCYFFVRFDRLIGCGID